MTKTITTRGIATPIAILAEDERPEFELISGELLFVGETTLPDPVLVVLVGIENVGNVFLAVVPVLVELDVSTKVIVEE
jgi:hypothetical protein